MRLFMGQRSESMLSLDRPWQRERTTITVLVRGRGVFAVVHRSSRSKEIPRWPGQVAVAARGLGSWRAARQASGDSDHTIEVCAA